VAVLVTPRRLNVIVSSPLRAHPQRDLAIEAMRMLNEHPVERLTKEPPAPTTEKRNKSVN